MTEDISSREFLDRITGVVPSQRQIDVQNLGYYNFIHFGLNTFTKKEWGSGKVSPDKFTLRDIDTDRWVQDLKSTGSKGIIITAKHHDGFCLFPSKYTDYTIASTVYRDGKGDIVKELSESCKKYGMKFGIYLSPWDRHEESYGTQAYNDFFCNQLTELCTNYGELFCFWFDGACGEGPNGRKQVYDWKRYYEIIRTLQPNAVVSICGPDLRWIGNERGRARKSEFSVVPVSLRGTEKIAEDSQQKAGATVMARRIRVTDECLGSREQLAGRELCWYPAEMDIPVTYFGWFWRPFFEIFAVRTVRNLMKCYYTSVGNNATLLVNVPPNNKGVMPKKYIRRLVKAKEKIEKRFSNQAEITGTENSGNVFTFRVNGERIRTVVLSEDVTKSQRIEEFHIEINGKTVYEGTTVGFKKICLFPKASEATNEVKLVIDKCRKEPVFHSVRLYK